MLIIEDMEFQTETEHAICVHASGDDSDIWLPKSQIEWEEDAERGDLIAVSLPEWLAEEKGLA